MNLEDIWNLGLKKKTITVSTSDGEDQTIGVYMRPLSFALIMQTAPNEDQEAATDLLAERIAYSVCNEKGEPIFTKEQIKGTADKSLGADIVLALITAVNSFNNFSKKSEGDEGK